MKKDRFDKAIELSYPYFLRMEKMFRKKFEAYDLDDVLAEVMVELYNKKTWLAMRSGKAVSVRGLIAKTYSRRIIDALRRQNRFNEAHPQITMEEAARTVSYDLFNALDQIIDKGKTKEDQAVIDAIL